MMPRRLVSMLKRLSYSCLGFVFELLGILGLAYGVAYNLCFEVFIQSWATKEQMYECD
jgi:hypothetical protein